MGQPLPALLYALWCFFLLWARWSARADYLKINVNCYCDYDTMIGCEWKVNRPTNCSSEFRLFYERSNDDSHPYECIPENKRNSETFSPLECMCQENVFDGFAKADSYNLKIVSAQRTVLWETPEFLPYENVKPRSPRNPVISTTPNNAFLLTWDSTYPSDHILTEELTYMVEIQKKDDPTFLREIPVIYAEANLTISAKILDNKCFYTARVKSRVSESQNYNGTWSDWSPAVEWYNEYDRSLDLELVVPIFCILILFVNLLCYFGVIKIKKVWWDQIPNPAHSHLTAIIIQDPQFSAWRKLPKAKDKKNFPHWKTCLSKLFPCFLNHNLSGREEFDDSKDTHLPHPSKQESQPMEICRAVLMPEQISVVQSVELYEAEVESEKGNEEDDDDVSVSSSSENSASSFIQNKEALTAMFVQTLFLDIIEGENFMPCSIQPPGKSKDLKHATQSPPQESKDPNDFWHSPTRPGSPTFQNGCPSGMHTSERSETVCQGPCLDVASPKVRQPEPQQEQWQFPSAAQTQDNGLALDLANASISEVPQVVADNPAYRSFSSLLAQSQHKSEEEPDPLLESSSCSWEQMAPCHKDPDPQHHVGCSQDSKTSSSQDSELSSLLQSEEESWEKILRQRVLSQEGAILCPTISATSGYRCFDNAVKQGNDQNYKAASFNVPRESGYRTFESLLNDTRKEASPEISGDKSESGKGDGGYRPFENLIFPSHKTQEVIPLPLFTFGLDFGETLPQKYQDSPVPSSILMTYNPQETSKEEIGKYSLKLVCDGIKNQEITPEESSVCSKLDFSSGIVYSTLTCHLCGHLKRCPNLDGNYTPLSTSQSTKCNCVVEAMKTLPHLTKANNLYPLEIMESPESGVPRTSSVEFLGERHSEEESSLGLCVSPSSL